MDAIKAILTRRSIRKFKTEKLDKDLIEKILRCAMQAPSAHNEQAWQFLVIDERKILDEISQFHPHASMCEAAPLAILVLADLNFEKSKDFWIMDCAAATQNILISSHDLGLGSVWVGIYPKDDYIKNFKDFFKLPKNLIPISLIPLGYPDEKKEVEDRFKKEKIHFNII